MLNRALTIYLYIAFLLSGACGLIYEVLWSRYLAELMGATALSHLVVLTTFMGGLAIGAAVCGRLVDRWTKGLLFYGVLECFLGCYGLFFAVFYRVAEQGYLTVGFGLEPGSVTLFLLKIGVSALLVLPPAVCMGGTLPVIVHFLTRRPHLLRRNVGLLYGLNSLGAVLGTLMAGFYLIHRFGLANSMMLTGGFNLAIGLSAVILGVWPGRQAIQRSTPELQADEIEEADPVAEDEIFSSAYFRLALVCAAVSGFGAMALEVFWIRYFSIVLGSTNSSFAIVLAAFIGGISLGSFLISSRWIGRLSLPKLLAFIFLLTAAILALSLFIYGRLPFELGMILSILERTPQAWLPYQFLRFALCFVIMLAPTIAAGMIFPLCVRLAGGRKTGRLGSEVALVYTVNTIGALLGIIITGQLLFRAVSLPTTLQIIFLIYLGAALLVALVTVRGKLRLGFTGLALTLLVAQVGWWAPWLPQLLYVGYIDFGTEATIDYDTFHRTRLLRKVVVERLGSDVHAAVIEHPKDNQGMSFRSLVINGKTDASSHMKDMPTQIMLGQLPTLLHPAPRKVFVLGVGSGVSSGEVLKHQGVEKVVTAELAAEVFEASKAFASVNNRFWEDPRHRMVIDDGKTVLQLSDEMYDVIIMKPGNIWQSGMAGLFTEDFFRLVSSRLAPGGLVCQWLYDYKTDDLTLNIVLKTFAQAFDNVRVFKLDNGDQLLLASHEAWQFEPKNFQDRSRAPAIKETFERYGITGPLELLARQTMEPVSFRDNAGIVAAPVHTMDRPVLERAAEYGKFLGKRSKLFAARDIRNDPENTNLLLHDYMQEVDILPAELIKVLGSRTFKGNSQAGNGFLMKTIEALRSLPDKTHISPESLGVVIDPRISRVLNHPLLTADPGSMTPAEAKEMLAAEIFMWQTAASSFWKPNPDRLEMLASRVMNDDPQLSGPVSYGIAKVLAQTDACSIALPFMRKAEAAGHLTAENPGKGILSFFHCEVKKGDPDKALLWWQAIEATGKYRDLEPLFDERRRLALKRGERFEQE